MAHELTRVQGRVSPSGRLECPVGHCLGQINQDFEEEHKCRNCSRAAGTDVVVFFDLEEINEASLIQYSLENLRRIIDSQSQLTALIQARQPTT